MLNITHDYSVYYLYMLFGTSSLIIKEIKFVVPISLNTLSLKIFVSSVEHTKNLGLRCFDFVSLVECLLQIKRGHWDKKVNFPYFPLKHSFYIVIHSLEPSR